VDHRLRCAVFESGRASIRNGSGGGY
jgi:hypothetical protein